MFPNVVYGDKSLTRKQQARLTGRRVDQLFLHFWDLLYHSPVIVKQFLFSDRLMLEVRLSFDELSVAFVFPRRNEKGFVTWSSIPGFGAKPLFSIWMKSEFHKVLLYPAKPGFQLPEFVYKMYERKLIKMRRKHSPLNIFSRKGT